MQLAINLGGLVGISLFLAVRFRDSLVQTLPVSLCSIALALYVLAFFRKLRWITAILALCLAALAALFLVKGRRRGFRWAARTACGPLKDPQFWINAAALAAVVLLVHYRKVLEWDAYNFWGADIKSLFYRGGFAQRGSNVAPGFGDYPPNTQLLIWWFMNLFGRCDEGLMFGGYFFFSGLLLFSAAGRLRLRRLSHRVIAGAGAAALLFALPSVADTSWYRSLYADPVMGILFGCLLCTVALDDVCAEGFHRYKCAVFLMAMTLTKSVGFLWAAYGIVFYLLWNGAGRKRLRHAGAMALAAAACGASWSVYCRALQRATYLTAALAPGIGDRVREILDGSFLGGGRGRAYAGAYIKAFLFEPVHRARTGAVDLTPALVMALVLAAFFCFRRARWLSKGRFRRLMGFILGVYGLTYLILLCGHLTIFYDETQYLDPANMLTQMTRYGAPMNTGFLMLGFSICLERLGCAEDGRAGRLLPYLAALTVLLCAGYSTMADCLVEGHDPLDPQRLARRGEFAERYADFLEELSQVPIAGPYQRVLLLYSGAEYSPIVSFLASPVSVQAAHYGPELTGAELREMVERTGASWLYVQDGTAEEAARLADILDGCGINTLYNLSQRRISQWE